MVNIRKANTSGIEYERKLYIPLVDILGNIQLKKTLAKQSLHQRIQILLPSFISC